MSANDKAEGFEDPDDNYDEDIKDSMKSTEFGIAFGAGVDFVMGKGKLTFDGRYDLGSPRSSIGPAAGSQNRYHRFHGRLQLLSLPPGYQPISTPRPATRGFSWTTLSPILLDFLTPCSYPVKKEGLGIVERTPRATPVSVRSDLPTRKGEFA